MESVTGSTTHFWSHIYLSIHTPSVRKDTHFLGIVSSALYHGKKRFFLSFDLSFFFIDVYTSARIRSVFTFLFFFLPC